MALAVGGAEESLLSRPRTLDLVLKKRQGFVRIALQSGQPHAKAVLLHWAMSSKGSSVTMCMQLSTVMPS